MGDRRAQTKCWSRRGWFALLVVPYVALLCVPLYARDDPMLFGFPFFYWYQFAWGILTIAIMGIVSRATRPPRRAPPHPNGHGEP